ncbi:MAG TPA: hypothetical protein VMF32_21525 [Xanthobacteraceae bacterium]|nr:hypothetical protein [Xanthobacteraceae bacterium]
MSAQAVRPRPIGPTVANLEAVICKTAAEQRNGNAGNNLIDAALEDCESHQQGEQPARDAAQY